MTTAAASPACLLDASIYIFRYYFSLPDNWWSTDGYPTAAVYGYTGFLIRFLANQRPVYMAACFDGSLGSCFRNELYPRYKSSRALPDEALEFQLRACRQVTELLSISCLASTRFEADDLIGQLLQRLQYQQSETAVAVLSRDKDLGQLLSRSEDFLWDVGSGAASQQSEKIHRAQIKKRFGVWPEQLADYLALVGDTVDDIPGVPGIGPKTATALLEFAGDLEQLFSRLEELPGLKLRGAARLPDKLREYHDQIMLARRLATIDRALTEAVSEVDLRRGLPDAAGFRDFCTAMGFAGAFEQPLQKLLREATC